MFSLRGVACSEHSAHPWLLFTHVCVRRQHLVLDSGRVGEGGRPDEEEVGGEIAAGVTGEPELMGI